MVCTKCQINICLLCFCVLGTISLVGHVLSTVGKFTSSLVHHFQDLSTGCTLHWPLPRLGREGFERFAHLYALNVIASNSRFLVFSIIFRKNGHSGVWQLFTAPSLGESRKKSRCDTNFVRGTCSTALGIYSVYYRNTFLTSMILPCTMVFSTMCPPRLLPTLALLLQACSTRRHLRYCFPAFLLQAGHPGLLTFGKVSTVLLTW